MNPLLPHLITLVEQVAQAIMPIYQSQDENLLSLKSDGSPLTQADILANQMITEALRALTPGIPVLSEESCDIPFSERQTWQRYWLVDPIDGTKEFLAKNGDFTINIALIEHHQPVLGVIGVPVLETVYYAAKGEDAWKKTAQALTPLKTREFDANRPVLLVASRRHGQNAIEKINMHYPECELVLRGSSLKFCLLAEGQVDLYPRLGFTSEWDTAAAQCILEVAGGEVIDLHGLPLRYNMRNSYQNSYFLAVADPSAQWQKFFVNL